VGVVCRSRDIVVPQEVLRSGSFIHVVTASQATPTLPPPGQGEGSNEQSDNSTRPRPALKPLLREVLQLSH
jgi:hypothetical protein